MKNVFKVIYALIAIALIYVLYLIALNGRYEISTYGNSQMIIDKWKGRSLENYHYEDRFVWQDWGKDPRNK